MTLANTVYRGVLYGLIPELIKDLTLGNTV